MKKIITIAVVVLLVGYVILLFLQKRTDQKTSEVITDDSCVTKHNGSPTGTSYSIYGSCYWENNSPIDFLNDLKSHPNVQMTIVGEAPKKWIKKEHIAQLINLLDSNEPAAPVLSVFSSYSAFGRTSTVGNEAAFLIVGYRGGIYPPGHCSITYGDEKYGFFGFKADIEEIKQWWKNEK